jgi:hypothetical protein
MGRLGLIIPAKVINIALLKLNCLMMHCSYIKIKIGTKPYGCILFLFRLIGR